MFKFIKPIRIGAGAWLLLSLSLLLILTSCINLPETDRLLTRDLTIGVGAALPDAEDFFPDGLPEGYYAAFAEEYRISHTGDYPITLTVTDSHGRAAEYAVTLSIVVDNTPPTVEGVGDISVLLGEGISYRSGITLHDNCDGKLTLTVDSSAVDPTKEGQYPVRYTATDAAGNKTELEIAVYIYREAVDADKLYALLDPIIAANIPKNATKEQQVRAIYDYVYYSIDYTPTSDKSDWMRAAYEGLVNRTGDCYTYFAVSKAFFERLGIENVDLHRTEGIVDERHYWSMVNIGSEADPRWYHYDATRLRGVQHSGCLLTDLQIRTYTKIREDENGVTGYFYAYDASKYPKSAEKIITATPSLEPYY